MKLKTKVYTIILSIFLLLIVSCSQEIRCSEPLSLVNGSCCVDANHDNTCDVLATPLLEKEETSSQIEVEYGRIILNETQLEDMISRSNNQRYTFYTDSENPTHRISNQERHVDIETRSNRIYEPMEFMDAYGMVLWDGFTRYINQSRNQLLHIPLQSVDVKDYRSYTQRRMIIERLVRENAYKVEHGVVLEYQLLFFQYDQFGNYQGPWEESVIVYKVYCSPEYIVILRPEGVEGERDIGGVDSATALSNFDLEMDRLRPRMLSRAEAILEYCSPSQSFFTELESISTENKEVYAYDERIYLERFATINTSFGVELEYRPVAGKKVKLYKVSVGFTNNDLIPLEGPLYLDIRASADGKGNFEVASDKRFVTRILVQDSFERSFEPLRDIEFMNNISFDVRLYRESDNAVIRPYLITFGREGEIVLQEPLQIS